MKYAVIDNLSRLLRGRLQITIPEDQEFDTNLFSADNAYNPTVGSQTVDLVVIEQIARQEESKIDLYLSQIYVYPLKLVNDITIDILGNLSELYIASTLLSIHFQGQSPNIVATDISSSATDWRRQADFIMSQLLASSGIHFPTSIQAQSQSASVKQQRPLVLPGEVLLSQSDLPDIIDRNYTFEGRRNIKNTNIYFDFDDGTPCQGKRNGNAFGTESHFDVCTQRHTSNTKF